MPYSPRLQSCRLQSTAHLRGCGAAAGDRNGAGCSCAGALDISGLALLPAMQDSQHRHNGPGRRLVLSLVLLQIVSSEERGDH